MKKRHELTDEQWNRLQAALPNPTKVGRPGADVRLFLNAVTWIAKTGSPWRDLPERFGAWNLVYQRFSYWTKKGHFSRLFEAVQADSDNSQVMIDSTAIKRHQHACGAKKKHGA